MSRMICGVVLWLSMVVICGPALAEDWNQWRGPNRNGRIEEDVKLTEKTKFVQQWKADIGVGFSAVSVADGLAYTMGNAADKDTVWCFNALTGKEVWKFSYPAELDPNLFEGGPTSTPTVVNGKVYTIGRKGQIFCFDAKNGNRIWTLDLRTELKPEIPQFGFAGSALVVGDTVIFNVGSRGLGLNANTGKPVWKLENSEAAGYNSPLRVPVGSSSIVVLSNGNNVNAIDPATGELRWSHPWATRYGLNNADPIVVANDLMLLSSGYTKGASLVKFTSKGAEEVWRKRQPGSQMAPGIFYQDHVYATDGDSGEETFFVCVDPKGAVKWKHPGLGNATAIGIKDKLLVLSAEGELHIVNASPAKFESLANTKLTDQKCWTPPTYCNGMVYIRDAAGNLVAAKVTN